MTIDICSQYDMLASRRESADTMLWEAPTISLTAQAFLLNTALDSNEWESVVVSSLLSFATSLAALHLMMKHRFFEQRDSIFLQKLEERYATYLFNAKPPSVIGSSYVRWLYALAAFGFGAAIACCRAFFMIPDRHLHWIGKLGASVVLCVIAAAVLAYFIRTWDEDITAAFADLDGQPLEAFTATPRRQP